MEHIANMTIGQIAFGVTHHIAWFLILVSFALNFEAIVRQVAVNRGYKNVVTLCDRIANFFGFIIEVVDAAKKGIASSAPKLVVLILCVAGIATGCALAGGTTVRVKGTDIKSAYGSGDADIVVRSQHCWNLFGGKCSNVGQDQTVNSVTNGVTNTETVNDTIAPVVK